MHQPTTFLRQIGPLKSEATLAVLANRFRSSRFINRIGWDKHAQGVEVKLLMDEFKLISPTPLYRDKNQFKSGDEFCHSLTGRSY